MLPLYYMLFISPWVLSVFKSSSKLGLFQNALNVFCLLCSGHFGLNFNLILFLKGLMLRLFWLCSTRIIVVLRESVIYFACSV